MAKPLKRNLLHDPPPPGSLLCANNSCQHAEHHHAYKAFTANKRGACLIPGCPCHGFVSPLEEEKRSAA
jgi:hypothetical protein